MSSWEAFEARAALIEWRHTDGTPCPETMIDRLTTEDGQQWWCTTHQQHLVGTARESACGGETS